MTRYITMHSVLSFFCLSLSSRFDRELIHWVYSVFGLWPVRSQRKGNQQAIVICWRTPWSQFACSLVEMKNRTACMPTSATTTKNASKEEKAWLVALNEWMCNIGLSRVSVALLYSRRRADHLLRPSTGKSAGLISGGICSEDSSTTIRDVQLMMINTNCT